MQFPNGNRQYIAAAYLAQKDEVFKKALEKYEHEKEIIKELEAGKTTLEIYGFDKIIARKS